jgi:hypothetical protein
MNRELGEKSKLPGKTLVLGRKQGQKTGSLLASGTLSGFQVILRAREQ